MCHVSCSIMIHGDCLLPMAIGNRNWPTHRSMMPLDSVTNSLCREHMGLCKAMLVPAGQRVQLQVRQVVLSFSGSGAAVLPLTARDAELATSRALGSTNKLSLSSAVAYALNGLPALVKLGLGQGRTACLRSASWSKKSAEGGCSAATVPWRSFRVGCSGL